MPRKTYSELAAGLFVVAGLAVLLGVVLWLGAADLLRARGQLVSFYVPQSAGSVGIVEGAEVTLGDGRIGRVVDIAPDPGAGRCLYRARLERTDITIRRDANAVVISPPVGQAKIVLLSAGRADQPGDDAHPVLLTGGLDRAMQHIDDLAGNLAAASRKLRGELDPNVAGSLLGDIHAIVGEIRLAARSVVGLTGNLESETKAQDPKSLVGKLHRSAGDINTTTARLARQMDPNAADALVARANRAAGHVEAATDPNTPGSLMAKAHKAFDDVQGIVEKGAPKIDRTLTALAGAAERIDAYTKKDVGEMLAQLREANTKILKIANDFAVVSEQAKEIVTLHRGNIDETMDNLAQVSVDLKSAAKEVRRNPWRLLYQPERKELRSQNLYDAVRAFSDGASQLDQAIAKLGALKRIESDDSASKATAEQVRARLQETFENFTKVEKALYEELLK